MPLAPLDDISTYQRIAEAAASRGMPAQTPPPQGPDKQAAVMQALQGIQPPLAPEQLQAVMQIIMMVMEEPENASEGGMMMGESD